MYFLKVKLDQDISELHSKMKNIMDEVRYFNRPIMSSTDSGWNPESDIFETENELFVNVNIAGVEKENIDVSVKDRYLKINGTRDHKSPSGSPTHYHQLEMGYGKFERIFYLPVNIENEGIEAFCENGLLTVRMKKKEKNKESHQIKIR